MPSFGPTGLDADELEVTFVQRECNWLQALEGDIDNSHTSFLHGYDIARRSSNKEVQQVSVVEKAPEYEVLNTAWGTMYGAARPAPDGKRVWRVGQFLFPFWTMPSPGNIRRHIVARAWVPMDDTHAMFVNMAWIGAQNDADADDDAESAGRSAHGSTLYARSNKLDYLPNSFDWFGRWRLAANSANDFKLDRRLQKRGLSYSGVTGVHVQDQAITESMGEMSDHGFEHLGPSDLMVSRTRRRLFQAAEALMRDGVSPPGVDEPQAFADARGGNYAAAEAAAFLETYRAEMKLAVHPGTAQ
jgi:hypothetical protein